MDASAIKWKKWISIVNMDARIMKIVVLLSMDASAINDKWK